MKKINFDISKKLALTYLIIIAVSALSGAFCFYALNKNKQADSELRYVSIPSLEKLKEMKTLTHEIKKLANSWVYLSNKKDKDRLIEILKSDFETTSTQVKKFAENWKDKSEKIYLSTSNNYNDKMVSSVKKIMDNLAQEDDYANDQKVDKAINEYEKNLIRVIDLNSANLDKLILAKEKSQEQLQESKASLLSMLKIVISSMLIVILIVSLISFSFTKRSVTNPMVGLKNIISNVAMGEVNTIHKINRSDEIGQMQNAISEMIEGLQKKINFSDEIGKGNYESDFELLSERDKLGSALVEMRKNLQKSAIEDEQRNWSAIGVAELGNLLRSNHDDESLFYNSIIQFLSKYCKVNQAGMFLLNESEAIAKMELVAMYAYDRRKFVEKEIALGEGLVGQCFNEKELIYLTDVPTDYANITSGLGEATPRNIVLLPLVVNETINGVIEIASFNILLPYQIEFLKKCAEIISSTITSIKGSAKTAKLLANTQQQAEELKTQEEEMRQNLEELQATQEEINRKENSYVSKIAELEKQLAEQVA